MPTLPKSENILDKLFEELNTHNEDTLPLEEKKKLLLPVITGSSPSTQPQNIPPIAPPQNTQPQTLQPPNLWIDAAKQAIANQATYPNRNDPQYQPSTTRRILGDIGGTLQGIISGNPNIGIQSAEAIKNQKYNQALGDFFRRQKALEQPIGASENINKEMGGIFTAERIAKRADELTDQGQQRINIAQKKRTLKPDKFKLPDGRTIDVNFDAQRNQYYDPAGNEIEIPANAERVGKPGVNIVRSVPHWDTIPNATYLQAHGHEFKDENGKEIDMSTIPPGMVLQGMEVGDRLFYVPRNVADKVVHVGNVAIAVNPAEVGTIPQGGGTTLGEVRTGSQNTPTQVVVDKEGVPHVVGSTTTPNTLGPTRTVTPRNQNLNQNQNQNQNLNRPPTKPQATIEPTSHAFREMPGVTPQMHAQLVKMSRPLREVVTHLFGDKSNPSLKSLNSYADIADNPAAVRRVGTALRMIMADTTKIEVGSEGTGWNMGGGVGTGPLLPVTISGHGGQSGFGRYLNLNPENAQKINSNIEKVMSELKDPRERELVDATLKAYEAAVGMRSVTQSSSALTAVETIQKTLPILGVNSFNRKDFHDRMIRWAQDGLNGAWGIPPNYLGPDVIQKLRDTIKEPESSGFNIGDMKRN